MKTLLAIDCITYNHEKFIKQTLDGFDLFRTQSCFHMLDREIPSPFPLTE